MGRFDDLKKRLENPNETAKLATMPSAQNLIQTTEIAPRLSQPENFTLGSDRPEDIAFQDQEAKALSDKFESIMGNPTAEDYMKRGLGGTKTAAEYKEFLDPANFVGGIANVGKMGKSTAALLQEAKAAGKSGAVQVPSMGERYVAEKAAEKAARQLEKTGTTAQIQKPSMQQYIDHYKQNFEQDLLKRKKYLSPQEFQDMKQARVNESVRLVNQEHADILKKLGLK